MQRFSIEDLFPHCILPFLLLHLSSQGLPDIWTHSYLDAWVYYYNLSTVKGHQMTTSPEIITLTKTNFGASNMSFHRFFLMLSRSCSSILSLEPQNDLQMTSILKSDDFNWFSIPNKPIKRHLTMPMGDLTKKRLYLQGIICHLRSFGGHLLSRNPKPRWDLVKLLWF